MKQPKRGKVIAHGDVRKVRYGNVTAIDNPKTDHISYHYAGEDGAKAEPAQVRTKLGAAITSQRQRKGAVKLFEARNQVPASMTITSGRNSQGEKMRGKKINVSKGDVVGEVSRNGRAKLQLADGSTVRAVVNVPGAKVKERSKTNNTTREAKKNVPGIGADACEAHPTPRKR